MTPKNLRAPLTAPNAKRQPSRFDHSTSEECILGFLRADCGQRATQVEITFQEVRAHFGVETQRQWSEVSIERTTPVLFGMYSVVCLWAGEFLA